MIHINSGKVKSVTVHQGLQYCSNRHNFRSCQTKPPPQWQILTYLLKASVWGTRGGEVEAWAVYEKCIRNVQRRPSIKRDAELSRHKLLLDAIVRAACFYEICTDICTSKQDRRIAGWLNGGMNRWMVIYICTHRYVLSYIMYV